MVHGGTDNTELNSTVIVQFIGIISYSFGVKIRKSGHVDSNLPHQKTVKLGSGINKKNNLS